MLDAFQARDLDRFVSMLDADVEILPIVGSELAGTVYRGHEGVRDWWDNYFARFRTVDVSVEQVRDLGDSVIAASRFHARDEEGATQPELVVWTVMDVSGDKIRS